MPHLDLSTSVIFASWTLFSIVSVLIIVIIIYPNSSRVQLAITI